MSSSSAAPAPSRSIESELIHNTLLCGDDIRQSSVHWLQDSGALRHRYERFEEGTEAVTSPPPVDFAASGVLLIAMGPRPTSGFRLNPLPQETPRLIGSILEVPVAWQEPDAESAQAQAATNPCILLSIEQVGFSRIRIIDQNGVVRVEADRSAALDNGS